MAVLIGSARSDERGKLIGGQAGDQTGKEVSTQNWYLHKKGWVIIRAKDPAKREKIAIAMERICINDYIGYDQGNRNGLFNAIKNMNFDPKRCKVKTECDCSAGVRVCVHYAGITCADFNTASEVSVLKGTGQFEIITDASKTKTSDYLLRGDILVTATKGHTVVVLSDGAKAKSTSSNKKEEKMQAAQYTVKEGTKGSQAKLLQKNLNKVINAGLAEDGVFGAKSVAALKKFQKANGLKEDGVYGKSTYKKMKEILEK